MFLQTQKRIYKTYAKQLGMMVRCKNMKCSYKRKKVDADITIIYDEINIQKRKGQTNMKNAINILAIIFAWGALILSIFAFGDMTGNIFKAVTYGLIVGNAVLVNSICVHNLKENKE